MQFARLLPLAALAFVSPVLADEGMDFFEKKVRPLLAERCLECHSAEHKIKGGLRLDLRDGWVKGGDAGPAIVPGDVAKSLLIEAVHYGNLDLQMPPKKPLTKEEISILEEWVKLGAPDPRTEGAVVKKQTGLSLEAGRKFWAYAPITNPSVPNLKDTTWPQGEIDRFVLAKMETSNVKPSPAAKPDALARRLYYTLIGLPPTPQQVDEFTAAAAKDSAKAAEVLVDELLASKQFGETWGRHWLDLARFAESSGGGRTLLFKDAWRFRDYVIEAFNADMPFDQFIREQIAGDLLPAATQADQKRQCIATAFLALGPTNYEEQDKQQLRFDVVDEQIETVGRALLGQTIGCARCHDHKFDPIPQRDYYALAGIFASTRTLMSYEENVARWISQPLPEDGPQEALLVAHETKVKSLEKQLTQAKAKLTELSKYIAAETSAPAMPIAPASLPGIVLDDADAKVVGEWKHSVHVRSYIGKGYLSDDNKAKGERTISFTPTIPQTDSYEVRLAYTHAHVRANNVKVNILHADGEDTIYVDQSLPPPIDGRFVSLGKFRFEKDGAGYVLLSNEGTTSFVTVDALQLIPTSDKTATAKESPSDDVAVKKVKQLVKRLEAEMKQLSDHSLRRQTAMTVHDDAGAIGDAQVRVRGIEKQRGETVPRGFLQVVTTSSPTFPAKQSGRKELAEWIASADHPLTSRVLANRIWTWAFGQGLVRTVDNFGTTGELPSHPELLDFLALKLTKQQWSVKKLLREILLSSTWQQAVQSATSEDPENRLLAHANRRRLDAEQIRDTLLSLSGKLEPSYLGQNIAGAGDIDPNNFSAQDIEYGYKFTDTKRSVYVPAFRNKRLDLFEVFDFGDINQPVGQRNVSTVAPQALYFLNHPFVLEQAKAAAERVMAEMTADEDRLALTFRRTLGRLPSVAESARCREFLQSSPNASEAWTALQQSLFASLDFRYLP